MANDWRNNGRRQLPIPRPTQRSGEHLRGPEGTTGAREGDPGVQRPVRGRPVRRGEVRRREERAKQGEPLLGRRPSALPALTLGQFHGSRRGRDVVLFNSARVRDPGLGVERPLRLLRPPVRQRDRAHDLLHLLRPWRDERGRREGCIEGRCADVVRELLRRRRRRGAQEAEVEAAQARQENVAVPEGHPAVRPLLQMALQRDRPLQPQAILRDGVGPRRRRHPGHRVGYLPALLFGDKEPQR
mmetsp:Transcript_152876/g.490408  ORF Transcript_152876/g.490408 Transcript_152876/m.490408 type:complete len:243 (+) Transcript_152876:359-1087(+)